MFFGCVEPGFFLYGIFIPFGDRLEPKMRGIQIREMMLLGYGLDRLEKPYRGATGKPAKY